MSIEGTWGEGRQVQVADRRGIRGGVGRAKFLVCVGVRGVGSRRVHHARRGRAGTCARASPRACPPVVRRGGEGAEWGVRRRRWGGNTRYNHNHGGDASDCAVCLGATGRSSGPVSPSEPRRAARADPCGSSLLPLRHSWARIAPRTKCVKRKTKSRSLHITIMDHNSYVLCPDRSVCLLPHAHPRNPKGARHQLE
jgi:hypothetical protein